MNLKEAVYKISRHPALGPVGRSFYFFCEHLLTHTFKGFPEIRSAYVAGSMSEGDIVPGLSDIDCVITMDDLDAREEYRLMTGLERKIRYRMPPFGKDKIGVHVAAYSSAEWSLLGDLFLGKKKAARPFQEQRDSGGLQVRRQDKGASPPPEGAMEDNKPHRQHSKTVREPSPAGINETNYRKDNAHTGLCH